MYCIGLDLISASTTTKVEQHSATPVATPVRQRDGATDSVGDSGNGGSEPNVSMKLLALEDTNQKPTQPEDTTGASAKPVVVPKLIGGLTQRQAWFSGNSWVCVVFNTHQL